MTVRELIEQLSKVEDQSLEVKYGDIDHEYGEVFVWSINYPKVEVDKLTGEQIVNIGVHDS